jgi:hypothetical protein
MTLSTFPTFLTFLAEALCFPVPFSAPRQGWKSRPTLAASAVERRTVGPQGDALTRWPDSTSEYTMLPRLPLPDRRSHASGS